MTTLILRRDFRVAHSAGPARDLAGEEVLRFLRRGAPGFGALRGEFLRDIGALESRDGGLVQLRHDLRGQPLRSSQRVPGERLEFRYYGFGNGRRVFERAETLPGREREQLHLAALHLRRDA